MADTLTDVQKELVAAKSDLVRLATNAAAEAAVAAAKIKDLTQQLESFTSDKNTVLEKLKRDLVAAETAAKVFETELLSKLPTWAHVALSLLSAAVGAVVTYTLK
jgi:hypothetical protein